MRLCILIFMEAVLFVGIQATGKTEFYRRHFFDTHLRLSAAQLKNRHRQKILLAACIEAKQAFVSDNVNTSAWERTPTIEKAREAGFKVIGYYFRSDFSEAWKRNETRSGRAKTPEVLLRAALGRLERPKFSEGFDKLFYVFINPEGEFEIVDWERVD